MSKAVLISIKPKWCEKIINGDKTIEVRKTRPKLHTPFKCYIYCTLQGCNEFFRVCLGRDVAKWNRGKWADRKGKVIGEFTCDRIFPINVFDNGSIQNWCFEHMERSCLTYEELAGYIGNGKTGYGWHITDLRIYDVPRELREFWFPPEKYCVKELCGDCPHDQVADISCDYDSDCQWRRPLRRPPQSWCYVEEVCDEHC